LRRTLAVAALLFALPAAAEVEGAVSAELTVGGKQFALQANFEISPVLDRLWFTAGYGLLKAPDIAATDTTPKVTTQANHLLTAGVDVSPHKSWILSLQGQFSPRSVEAATLNSGALLTERLVMMSSHRSAGGVASVVFDTAGDSAFELGLDGSVGFTWNELGRKVTFANNTLYEAPYASLFVTRPTLGVSALIAQVLTLSVRAGYTFYTPPNPLTVGKFGPADLEALDAQLKAATERLAIDVDRARGAADAVLSRMTMFNAMSGYPYAPVRFDLKSAVKAKFSRAFQLQLAWTYLRYVETQGFGNVLALRGQFRFGGGWRAWVAVSAQLDAVVDQPAQPSDWAGTGHLTLGAEFAF
jgi:hypothetical protein